MKIQEICSPSGFIFLNLCYQSRHKVKYKTIPFIEHMQGCRALKETLGNYHI